MEGTMLFKNVPVGSFFINNERQSSRGIFFKDRIMRCSAWYLTDFGWNITAAMEQEDEVIILDINPKTRLHLKKIIFWPDEYATIYTVGVAKKLISFCFNEEEAGTLLAEVDNKELFEKILNEIRQIRKEKIFSKEYLFPITKLRYYRQKELIKRIGETIKRLDNK